MSRLIKKSYLMLLRIKKSSYFINVQNKVQQMSLRQRVILEFIKKNKKICDVIVLIQITNPFINYRILIKLLRNFKRKIRLNAFSKQSNKFLWIKKKFTKPINYNYKKRPMTQNLNGYLVENGSFYIFNTKSF